MPTEGGLEAVRTKVERYLDELYGGHELDPAGDFVVGSGSSAVWIAVAELPGGRAGVRVFSLTNVGVRVDDELTRYLVTENGKLVFGALHLLDDGPAVAVGHTLLGELLNRSELEVAVEAVGAVADHYDDLLKARFGGRIFGEPE